VQFTLLSSPIITGGAPISVVLARLSNSENLITLMEMDSLPIPRSPGVSFDSGRFPIQLSVVAISFVSPSEAEMFKREEAEGDGCRLGG
jgi:hypothetical protein